MVQAASSFGLCCWDACCGWGQRGFCGSLGSGSHGCGWVRTHEASLPRKHPPRQVAEHAVWRHACRPPCPHPRGMGSVGEGGLWSSRIRGALGCCSNLNYPPSLWLQAPLSAAAKLKQHNSAVSWHHPHNSHPQQSHLRTLWAGKPTLHAPLGPGRH